MASETPIIDVEGLGIVYETRAGEDLLAVESFSLNIRAGEYVSIIGPSGCGKSTILHSIGGLLKPTRGQIRIAGSAQRVPDPRVGAFVFQEYSLLPWKTVRENVAIGLRFAGVSRREREARAEHALRLVDLLTFAPAYPDELSGGMQQRVAVARALVMDPQILLMDEPFGALDEQTRRTLGVDMTRMLSQQGRTVVMVTHSLDEALFWGDRVIVMSSRPGRIIKEIMVQESRPRDLGFMMSDDFAHLRSDLMRSLSNGDTMHSPLEQ